MYIFSYKVTNLYIGLYILLMLYKPLMLYKTCYVLLLILYKINSAGSHNE